MAIFRHVLRAIILAGIFNDVNNLVRGEHLYLGEIFVNRCAEETWYFFPGYNPKPLYPYLIISMCHFKERHRIYSFQERTEFKPVAHFSPHKFHIIFWLIVTNEEVAIFEHIYQRLLISSGHLASFWYKQERFKDGDYRDFTADVFKLEYFRGRWNIDEIYVDYNSPAARGRLFFHDWQHPTSIQKNAEAFKTNNISDLARIKIFHSIQSGYGQACTHLNWIEKLGSLTFNFRAYDRIFCDALERYNLQDSMKDAYWPPGAYHLRGRFLRDNILSVFPPDTANAVYYASPKLAFVVLQLGPQPSWLFATRPFNKYIWSAVLTIVGMLLISRYLNVFLDFLYRSFLVRKIGSANQERITSILQENRGKLSEINERYLNFLEISTSIFRIVVSSAYCGMILYGILYRTYPWIPTTFSELNRTENYYIATAIHSPGFIRDHLVNNLVLNGVNSSMFKNRINETPAEYLFDSEENKRNGKDEDVHYAVMMYTDKIQLWMKGRAFIHNTATCLQKIRRSKEKILPEIRYVSVAPGATRMHFLLETIRRVFTSGTWMRWHYLEENYYKNVAPLVAVKKILARGMKPIIEPDTRPLTLDDMFSVFVFGAVCLAIAYLVNVFEVYE